MLCAVLINSSNSKSVTPKFKILPNIFQTLRISPIRFLDPLPVFFYIFFYAIIESAFFTTVTVVLMPPETCKGR